MIYTYSVAFSSSVLGPTHLHFHGSDLGKSSMRPHDASKIDIVGEISSKPERDVNETIKRARCKREEALVS